MAKRISKAQMILNEVQERVDGARVKLEQCFRAVDAAKAELAAHTLAYRAVERTLAPKPRAPKSPV